MIINALHTSSHLFLNVLFAIITPVFLYHLSRLPL